MATFRNNMEAERKRRGAELLRGPHGIPQHHMEAMQRFAAQHPGAELGVPLTDIYHRLATYDDHRGRIPAGVRLVNEPFIQLQNL